MRHYAWALAFVQLVSMVATQEIVAQDKYQPQAAPSAALTLLTRSPWAVTAKLRCGNPIAGCPDTEHWNAPQAAPARVGAPLLQPHAYNPLIDKETFVPLVGIGTMCEGTGPCRTLNGVNKDYVKEVKDVVDKSPIPKVQPTIPRPSPGTVIVIWESAAAVKDAKARLGFATSPYNRKRSAYVITIFGYPLRKAVGEKAVLSPEIPDYIKNLVLDSAVLSLKNKTAIAPFDVEFDGDEYSATLRYFFPVDRAIALSDGEVKCTLHVLLGDAVEATFKLKDMTTGGKLELIESAN